MSQTHTDEDYPTTNKKGATMQILTREEELNKQVRQLEKQNALLRVQNKDLQKDNRLSYMAFGLLMSDLFVAISGKTPSDLCIKDEYEKYIKESIEKLEASNQ